MPCSTAAQRLFPSLAGWALVFGSAADNEKCWAEIGRDGWEYSVPCGKAIVCAIGLCAYHYLEITGEEWREEQSHAAGVKADTTRSVPG